VLRYDELHAYDAAGRELPARLTLAGPDAALSTQHSALFIVVDTAGAVYPLTIDPLSTTPNWNAEGNQAASSFGYAVATAGDVNGDSYGDVIVGALLYDNGQADEGRAFVYHGSAGGLSVTANWTAESDQAGARFGAAVAAAGDVNGGGYADVIVGAPYYDNGQTDEGRALVSTARRSASARSPTGPSRATGPTQFGIAVSTAGDVAATALPTSSSSG
jgi:hypothetical protein